MTYAVIFDADDTLWRTEPLYESALDDAQGEVERLGLDGSLWRKLQREIDLERVTQFGFAPQRFPTSSIEAFRLLSPHYDMQAEERIYRLSAAVFREQAKLIPHVHKVLSALHVNYQLGLLTRGDRKVQHQRIRQSGLVDHFRAIAIVEQKTASSFGAMCDLLSVPSSLTVSVGNSIKWDILPAIECGLQAVLIESPTWQCESRTHVQIPKDVIRLESLDHLPRALERLTSSG